MVINGCYMVPVVPHKAVAEISKIGNLYERLVVVNQGMAERIHWWTDRWLRSPLFLSFFLSFFLSSSDYLSIYLI